MDQRTLSERVQRIEKILTISGFGEISAAVDRDGPQNPEEVVFNKIATHREQTGFEEIIQRIQGCIDRVCVTADKIEKISDRIMGALSNTRDEQATASGKTPDGTLDHTFMALDFLDHSLTRLEQAAMRMECV